MTQQPYFVATREGMKRVTVAISPEDHTKLKIRAVESGRTIESLMREAVAAVLANTETRTGRTSMTDNELPLPSKQHQPISRHDRERALAVLHQQASKKNDLLKMIKDEPGVFMMISKYELLVDDTYQRGETTLRVIQLAADWSWAACGAIIVGAREGTGNWYVIEGQHRVMAARRRADINDLPCLVFETTGAIEEARTFLIANTNRRPMHVIEKLKALTVTGDKASLVLGELARKSGRMIHSSAGPTSISCIGKMKMCIERDELSVRRIWPLVVKICDGRILHERILLGLFHLERNIEGDDSICNPKWEKRLMIVGYDNLLTAINDARVHFKQGSPIIYARGVLQAINYKLRDETRLKMTDRRAQET